MILDLEFGLTDQSISLDFGDDGKLIELGFEYFQQLISHDVERYDGEYKVKPRIEEQTLPTKQKLMEKDLTVLAIPYYEVSNESDGNTVYIAKELE